MGVNGINSISCIAMLIMGAQFNEKLESSFSIEKGCVFIHIKEGDNNLLNSVEPIAYYNDIDKARLISDAVVEILTSHGK